MSARIWVDATAGIAGDMLLAALLDAGARLGAVRAAIEAVLPDEVRLEVERVHRCSLAALHVQVRQQDVSPARSWAELRAVLEGADLAEDVRAGAVATFEVLAEAEARAHGTPVDQVHFHEVGAWDSVADVVGTCAALTDLGVTHVTSSPIGLGSGTVRTQHGTMPVPVPAVLGILGASDLVPADDDSLTGECATPTGVALLAALGAGVQAGPVGRVTGSGSGAGTRDTPGRANVTRAVLLAPDATALGDERATGSLDLEHETFLEVSATVDDLDPRVWPEVLGLLLDAGARDAWLTPVLMKKGRPGHVITVLADPPDRARVVDLLLTHTTTLGVRSHAVQRSSLARTWREVEVTGGTARVKIGGRAGRVVTVTPELEDCLSLARAGDTPLREVLREVETAAAQSGWVPGAAI